MFKISLLNAVRNYLVLLVWLMHAAVTLKICFTEAATRSLQKCSMKKGALEIFAKFKGKHLCQSLFLNKVAGHLF